MRKIEKTRTAIKTISPANDLARSPVIQVTERGEIPELARIRAEVVEIMRGFITYENRSFLADCKRLQALRSRAQAASRETVVILDEGLRALEACDTSERKIRAYLSGAE